MRKKSGRRGKNLNMTLEQIQSKKQKNLDTIGEEFGKTWGRFKSDRVSKFSSVRLVKCQNPYFLLPGYKN